MPLSMLSKKIATKVLLATVLLSMLAGVAGSQLAPKVPLHWVLLYSALGAVVFFAFLILATIATLTLIQFLLRKGGTDPQWFWFSAEPPGLVQLRERARKQHGKLP
jgi:hypothetical protein